MNKIFKMALIFSFCLIFILGYSIPTYADNAVPPTTDNQTAVDDQTFAATYLQHLGLFSGTNKGFELDRPPTRAEGAVMLVRLLGKEQEAKQRQYVHPFKDVPVWASPYVGYLYQNQLTHGISNSQFGSSQSLSALQYVTFVLRALGYDDSNGDFKWNTALNKGLAIGLLNQQDVSDLQQNTFTRGNTVLISYYALDSHLKNTKSRLLDKLHTDQVFTEDQLNSALAYENGTTTTTTSTTNSSVNQIAQADYTVFVYMVASDLEDKYDDITHTLSGAATKDLQEMAKIGSNSNINVIVETGGTLKWDNPYMSGDQVQRWKIKNGSYQKLADLGKKNLGDPSTLTDFITWGKQTYPAKKYMMVFWDHGGGSVDGYGSDEHFNGDNLTLAELKNAMEQASQKDPSTFELIGFDACLMGNLETATVFQPYAKYMVGSEEVEPGDGWDYTAILSYLEAHPQTNGQSLGKVVADGFVNQSNQDGEGTGVTLSVLDLSKIPTVVTALNTWSNQIVNNLKNTDGIYQISKYRGKSEDYGRGSSNDDNTDMTDLSDLASQFTPLDAKDSTSLITAVNSAVTYTVHGSGSPHSTGMSIYFPYRNKNAFQDNMNVYSQYSFSQPYQNLLTQYTQVALNTNEKVQFSDSNISGYSLTGGDSKPLQITIPQNSLSKVDQVFGTVGMYSEDQPGTIVYLGYDHHVNFDRTTGIVKYNISGEWPTLNGHLVYMDLLDESEDAIHYAIPAKLNGTKVDIYVDFEKQTNKYIIRGAWRGIDEQTGMADKNILKLKTGDTIIPLFESYDNNDTFSYAEYPKFTVDQPLTITYQPLPAGDYNYGFDIVDTTQNDTFTETVDVTLN